MFQEPCGHTRIRNNPPAQLDETGTILFLPELGQTKSRQDRSNLRIRLVLSGIHVRMARAAQHRDISGHRTLENGTARRSQSRRVPSINLLHIRSAHRTASAMALTVAGTRAPLSYCASFRAARMLVAIRSTPCEDKGRKLAQKGGYPPRRPRRRQSRSKPYPKSTVRRTILHPRNSLQTSSSRTSATSPTCRPTI